MGAMEGSGPRAGQIAASVALLAAYLTLNSSLNLLNRCGLGEASPELNL